jgi:hypothetical protein
MRFISVGCTVGKCNTTLIFSDLNRILRYTHQFYIYIKFLCSLTLKIIKFKIRLMFSSMKKDWRNLFL